MRFSLRAGALALALLAAAPASAQVSSGGSVTPIDSWGVGWLGRADGPLPQALWSGTNGAELKALFETIKPASMSPAARAALRRVLLSSGKAPESAGDLVLQRLRLLEEAGETDRAIDLRRRFPNASWGQEFEALDAARDLAANNTGPACRTVSSKPASDPNWMHLRALCLAIAGDFNAASTVAENYVQIMARAADGQKADPWLLNAIEAMREPTRTKPAGRYATMFDAAVSVHAKLSVPANAMAQTPPDVAAHIVRHAFSTPEQKRAALRLALDAGKLTPDDVRAALTAKDAAPAAAPAQQRNAPRPRPDLIALAIAAAEDDKLDAGARATAYATAMKASETASDFRLSAFALSADLAKLPKNDATLPHAETFARAALIAGAEKEAREWRALMDKAAKDKQDAFAAARIDLMLSLAAAPATSGANRPQAIVDRMLAALPAENPNPSAAAPTPAQRQIAVRRIEITRALFLHVGLGRALTPEQRTYLSTQRTAGRGVPDAALARIEAALDANSQAEAALAAVNQIGNDPSALSFAGLSDLLALMIRAGLPIDANAVALESLQVWKAL